MRIPALFSSARLARSFEFPDILFWIAIAYSAGLWWYTVPFTGDEKIYLTIATENWLAHNWLQPLLFGEPNYFKPPIQLWATLAGWKLFGYSQWGGLLPSVLATLATALGIGLLAQRFSGGRPAEVTAPLWFAGFAGTLTYGTTSQMEIWLALFFTWGWYFALEYERDGRPRFLYLAYTMAGLLALVKSPVHSACWVLGHWLYWGMVHRRRAGKQFRTPHLWGALAWGIAIGLSWYIAVALKDFNRFWDHYILRETTRQGGSNGSTAIGLYVDTVIQTLPLTLLFAGAAWVARTHKKIWPLIAGWGLFLVLVFSAVAYRTETYLYPLAPLFALIADVGTRRGIQAGPLRAHALAVGILLSLGGWILVAAGLLPWPFGSALIAVSLLHARAAWRGHVRWALVATLAWITVVRLGAVWIGQDDIRGLAEALRAKPQAHIVMLNDARDMFFETGTFGMGLGRPGVNALSMGQLVSELHAGNILVLADWQERRLPEIRSAAGGTLQVTEWKRWKRGFTKPGWRDFFQLSQRRDPEWENRNRRVFWLVSAK